MTPSDHRDPTARSRIQIHQGAASGIRITIPKAILFAVLNLALSAGSGLAYHKLEPSDHDQLVRISTRLEDLIKTVDDLRGELRSSR